VTHLQTALKISPNYFALSIIISMLTIFPQLFLIENLNYFFSIVLLAVLLILISHICKVLFSIFVLMLSIITILQLHVFIHWQGGLEAFLSRGSTAMISPDFEKAEYLSAYITMGDYFIFIYFFVLLVLTYIFIKKSHPCNLKKPFILISIVIFLILQNQEPIRIIKNFFPIDKRTKILINRHNFLKGNTLTNKSNNAMIYDKIIIIQGESANKHYMNVYGYKHSTTPFLSELSLKKNFYMYNTISAANITRLAVPTIYTNANVTEWKKGFINSTSLLTDFKRYGYTTNWISNQDQRGKYEDFTTSVAKESDNYIFLKEIYPESSNTDIVVKRFLDKKDKGHLKELTVFHLRGSHFKYTNRYTKDIAMYQDPKNIVEQYENSIFFSDYILQNIFSYYKNSHNKILFIYLSDHGEVVSNKIYGHANNPPFKDEYEIPLIIYSSIKNIRLDQLLEDNKKGTFNAENLNYIIKYISYLSNNKNISYSASVLSTSPSIIVNYNDLNFYEKSL